MKLVVVKALTDLILKSFLIITEKKRRSSPHISQSYSKKKQLQSKPLKVAIILS